MKFNDKVDLGRARTFLNDRSGTQYTLSFADHGVIPIILSRSGAFSFEANDPILGGNIIRWFTESFDCQGEDGQEVLGLVLQISGQGAYVLISLREEGRVSLNADLNGIKEGDLIRVRVESHGENDVPSLSVRV